jgi:hypothetical protein
VFSVAEIQTDRTDHRPCRRDGSHDFDFEFGEWTVQLSRLRSPLSGSRDWVEYQGTSVVRRVWDGRANLGELQVDGPDGHIEGLSLRLYDPDWIAKFKRQAARG